ncbi:MAG: 2-hydroxyacid dehydrogenase [Verrucomicrobia bacterium]|nr:2-hydroxyacid dehydrogenase [Verrucomicrobiota bacterium]
MLETAVYDTKPYDRQYLTAATHHIKWRFHEFRLSADTAVAAKGAQAVCVFVHDVADRSCLATLSKLGIRLLALRCAGHNNVDLAAARALNLAVVRVPAYSPHAVAEHTIALLLALSRKIHRAYNRVREHNFALNSLIGFEIHGKTVGVVGTGKIGRITAQIFRGFGAQVVAYDPAPSQDWAAQQNVTYLDWQALLAQSDIISLHLPLLTETHHLLNAEAFGRMKRGVIVLNTSRGKLIDTRALIAALKRGAVGGIALDVYEEEEGIFFEDLSDQVLLDDLLPRLLSFPNVLITAHQAFFTHEAMTEIARVTTTNLLKLETAEPWLPGTAL